MANLKTPPKKAGLNRAKLTDEQRCVSKVKATGLRCQNPHMPGISQCKQHARGRKALEAKAEAARVEAEINRQMDRELTRMERFTALIPANDPEARGDVALVTELRRTVNRIRVFDEWIQELKDGDIGWGRTFFEKKDDLGTDEVDDSYRVTRYEARANILYDMQMRERVHLLNISKTWITAGFKQKELDMQATLIQAFFAVQQQIVIGLGHDPADPSVRSVVHRAMQELAPQSIEA